MARPKKYYLTSPPPLAGGLILWPTLCLLLTRIRPPAAGKAEETPETSPNAPPPPAGALCTPAGTPAGPRSSPQRQKAATLPWELPGPEHLSLFGCCAPATGRWALARVEHLGLAGETDARMHALRGLPDDGDFTIRIVACRNRAGSVVVVSYGMADSRWGRRSAEALWRIKKTLTAYCNEGFCEEYWARTNDLHRVRVAL